MKAISIIFVILAIINIIIAIIKWIAEKENQISAIFGWLCAIIYCIDANT